MSKLFKKLAIKKKLVISMSILLVMIILISGTSLLTTRFIVATMENSSLYNSESLEILNDIEFNSNQVNKALLHSTISKSSRVNLDKVDKAKSNMSILINDVNLLVERYPDKEASLKLLNMTSDYNQTFEAFCTDAILNNKEKAIAEFNRNQDIAQIRFNETIDEYRAFLLAESANDTRDIHILKRFIIILFIFLTILSFTLSIYLIRIINSSVSNPIKQMLDISKDMLNGNLSVGINVDKSFETKDEIVEVERAFVEMTENIRTIISSLSTALNEMANSNFDIKLGNTEVFVGEYRELTRAVNGIIRNQSKTIQQIKNVSVDVNENVKKLTDNAATIIDNTSEQASSIQSISDNIKSIETDIQRNTEHSKKASKLAHEQRRRITESYENMQNMVKAMENISQKSKGIAKIIESIDDIAFQTNILALNAAVEASRAGEAGKGFSVVASQVRTLAQSSAQEATNINTLILDSIQAINNGSEIVDLSSESILNAARIIDELVNNIDEITEASVQQTLSVHDIDKSMVELNSVMDNNLRTSSNNTDNSQHLSNKADVLNSMVAKYKIKEIDSVAEETMQVSDYVDYNVLYNNYYDLEDAEEIVDNNADTSELSGIINVNIEEDVENLINSGKDILNSDVGEIKEEIKQRVKEKAQDIKENLEKELNSEEVKEFKAKARDKVQSIKEKITDKYEEYSSIPQNGEEHTLDEHNENEDILGVEPLDNTTEESSNAQENENSIYDEIKRDESEQISLDDLFSSEADDKYILTVDEDKKSIFESEDDEDILSEERKYLEEKNLLDSDN